MQTKKYNFHDRMQDMTKETIAKAIRNARERKGLSQTEVAKKAGITRNTVARIERGEQEPTFATVKKIAKVLDIDISKLDA